MKRAIDTGFIPAEGGLIRIHKGHLYPNDHPAVLAAPGLFVGEEPAPEERPATPEVPPAVAPAVEEPAPAPAPEETPAAPEEPAAATPAPEVPEAPAEEEPAPKETPAPTEAPAPEAAEVPAVEEPAPFTRRRERQVRQVRPRG